ncbi:heparan-alpha-glucosaminide N-acetyltransferase domain-containing protein [Pontimicrobium sp. SW4]|uniref:Heparan-alpha-glucosaminide N-acetyltransferase domain-containing protein n=1 Tax=Pontimicrobium sp. SW4 TaxID=3153519 RepID=A0AAU7BSW8_9FLAO
MISSNRVESVDLLRGLTIVAMILVNNPGTWSHVYAPLLHAEWHGLTPTDLIFPFFLFIVGISIHLAYRNKPKNKSTYKKIIIRSLKLFGLGFFLAWFLPYFPFFRDLEIVRIPGVLQRIGLVFLVSAILYLNFNWKVLLGIGLAILISYWIFLGFIPLPDGTLPTFDRASNNWAMYIDSNILREHMWKDDYDPEGLISTLPAIVSCISGVLIARILIGNYASKVLKLIIISLIFLVVGYTWSIWFPLNKAIWSSSFVLVTSGWATLILAIIYYLQDIKHIKFGAIFKQVGMNAITIFFLSGFVAKAFYLTKIGENKRIHSWLYDTFFTYDFFSDKFSSFLYALVVIGFYLLLANVLYRKKIFIKV